MEWIVVRRKKIEQELEIEHCGNIDVEYPIEKS